MQMASRDTRVSVIIATRNGSREIARVLRALLGGTRAPDEIIVLDQSDDDKTEIQVDQVRNEASASIIRYVPNARPGLCAHRNDAIAETTGDFIASVDDDIVVEPDWLAAMLLEWELQWKHGDVVITGQIKPAPHLKSTKFITALKTVQHRIVYEGRPRVGNVLVGGQFGTSRKVLELLIPAPFDESLGVGSQFPGADDDEFAYRVLKLGVPVVYEPKIQVLHYALPIKKWRTMHFTRAIGIGAAMSKHAYGGDLRMIPDLIAYNLIQLGKSLKSLLKLDEPECTARIGAAVGATYGYFGWIIAKLTNTLLPDHVSSTTNDRST